MPDKKMNVLTQLLCVFQKKRPVCDDIVTAADKVIEEYIYCKNKLIHQKYSAQNKKESIVLSAMLISVAGAIVLLYLILAP